MYVLSTWWFPPRTLSLYAILTLDLSFGGSISPLYLLAQALAKAFEEDFEEVRYTEFTQIK